MAAFLYFMSSIYGLRKNFNQISTFFGTKKNKNNTIGQLRVYYFLQHKMCFRLHMRACFLFCIVSYIWRLRHFDSCLSFFIVFVVPFNLISVVVCVRYENRIKIRE